MSFGRKSEEKFGDRRERVHDSGKDESTACELPDSSQKLTDLAIHIDNRDVQRWKERGEFLSLSRPSESMNASPSQGPEAPVEAPMELHRFRFSSSARWLRLSDCCGKCGQGGHYPWECNLRIS